jgi:hypothetical protein
MQQVEHVEPANLDATIEAKPKSNCKGTEGQWRNDTVGFCLPESLGFKLALYALGCRSNGKI